MARIISEDELLKAVQEEEFIKNGTENNCKGTKYDFRINNELGVVRLHEGESDSLEGDGDVFVIKPGNTVFVTTKEILELPEDMFCQLRADEKTSHDGILMLDCFCMEPGYKGPLILVLYNASRKEDSFRLGTKLVAGVFYKLEPEEAEMVQKDPDLVYDFADHPPTSMEVFQNELKTSWQELEAQKLEELFAKEKSERKKILVRTSILSFLLGVFITVIIMLLLRHI